MPSARAGGEAMALVRLLDQQAQDRCERFDVVGRHQHAGIGRHRLRDRARGRCRQPAGHGRWPRHRPCRSPRSAKAARTDRKPHRASSARPQLTRRAWSMRSDKTHANDIAFQLPRRRRVARAVARDDEPPGQISERCERADQHVVAFARDHCADRKQCDVCRLPARRHLDAIGAGLDHADPFGCNAVIGGKQPSRRRARRNHMAGAGERRALARPQGIGLPAWSSRIRARADDAPARSARGARAAPALPPAARRRPARRSRPDARAAMPRAAQSAAHASAALGRGKPSPRSSTSHVPAERPSSAIMRRS